MYDRSSLGYDQTLDILIHEYLLKKSYTETLRVFKVEGQIPDYTMNKSVDPSVNGYIGSNLNLNGDNVIGNTPSTVGGGSVPVNVSTKSLLEEWFNAFNDIWSVRCGNVSDISCVSRIEGILLRLENEKKRHVLCKDEYRTIDPMSNKSYDDFYGNRGRYYSVDGHDNGKGLYDNGGIPNIRGNVYDNKECGYDVSPYDYKGNVYNPGAYGRSRNLPYNPSQFDYNNHERNLSYDLKGMPDVERSMDIYEDARVKRQPSQGLNINPNQGEKRMGSFQQERNDMVDKIDGYNAKMCLNNSPIQESLGNKSDINRGNHIYSSSRKESLCGDFHANRNQFNRSRDINNAKNIPDLISNKNQYNNNSINERNSNNVLEENTSIKENLNLHNGEKIRENYLIDRNHHKMNEQIKKEERRIDNQFLRTNEYDSYNDSTPTNQYNIINKHKIRPNEDISPSNSQYNMINKHSARINEDISPSNSQYNMINKHSARINEDISPPNNQYNRESMDITPTMKYHSRINAEHATNNNKYHRMNEDNNKHYQRNTMNQYPGITEDNIPINNRMNKENNQYSRIKDDCIPVNQYPFMNKGNNYNTNIEDNPQLINKYDVINDDINNTNQNTRMKKDCTSTNKYEKTNELGKSNESIKNKSPNINSNPNYNHDATNVNKNSPNIQNTPCSFNKTDVNSNQIIEKSPLLNDKHDISNEYKNSRRQSISIENKKRKEINNFPQITNIALFKNHNQKITCLQICPWMGLLITGGNDKIINIINVCSMKNEISYKPHSNIITDIKAIENDGNVIIGSSSLDGDISIQIYSRKLRGNNPKEITEVSATEIENNPIESGEYKEEDSMVASLEPYSSTSSMKMTSSVVCLGFTTHSTIIAADVEGQVCEWTLDGELIQSFEIRSIKSFIITGTDTLLISDRSMVYLYDYKKETIIKEISKESANFIHKTYKKRKGNEETTSTNYIIGMKNKVIVLDQNFNTILNKPSTEKLYSACILNDESIVLGGYQQIHIIKQKGGETQTMKIHENIVSCLESSIMGKDEFIYSSSYNGECAIWKYSKKKT